MFVEFMLVRESFKNLIATFKNFHFIEIILMKLRENIGKTSVFKA